MQPLGTVRRVPASLRLLTLSTACVAVLTACVGTSAPQAAPTPTVDAAAVNDAMAAVADARRVAAEQVDAELRAATRVDPIVAGLRSPSSIDQTLEEVPAVVTLFERADPAAGVAVLDRLDTALATAEAAITDAAAQVGPETWQARFLTAQREVLVALEEWSAASREVHRVVQEHWELWQGVVDAAAALDENRWLYRTQEEAAGTWEIEIGDQLEPLAAAAAALGAATDARDEAATAVTAADARAAEVFAARPTPGSTPTTAP